MTGGDPGSDETFDEVRRSHRDTSCADFEAEKSGNIVGTCSLVAHARDFFFDRKSYVFPVAKAMTAQWAAESRHFALISSSAGSRQNPRVPCKSRDFFSSWDTRFLAGALVGSGGQRVPGRKSIFSRSWDTLPFLALLRIFLLSLRVTA